MKPREFRGLRSATKDAVLGTCDLFQKVDQNFLADSVLCRFLLLEETIDEKSENFSHQQCEY